MHQHQNIASHTARCKAEKEGQSVYAWLTFWPPLYLFALPECCCCWLEVFCMLPWLQFALVFTCLCFSCFSYLICSCVYASTWFFQCTFTHLNVRFLDWCVALYIYTVGASLHYLWHLYFKHSMDALTHGNFYKCVNKYLSSGMALHIWYHS